MTGEARLPPIADPHQTDRPISAGTKIGHVHLKVADLDRALAFYCRVLGLQEQFSVSA